MSEEIPTMPESLSVKQLSMICIPLTGEVSWRVMASLFSYIVTLSPSTVSYGDPPLNIMKSSLHIRKREDHYCMMYG